MASLENLRKKINAVDAEIISQLSRRFRLTREVGKYKKKNNLKPYDKKRERELFETRIALGKKMGLETSLIKSLFKTIIKSVRAKHREIAKK